MKTYLIFLNIYIYHASHAIQLGNTFIFRPQVEKEKREDKKLENFDKLEQISRKADSKLPSHHEFTFIRNYPRSHQTSEILHEKIKNLIRINHLDLLNRIKSLSPRTRTATVLSENYQHTGIVKHGPSVNLNKSISKTTERIDCAQNSLCNLCLKLFLQRNICMTLFVKVPNMNSNSTGIYFPVKLKHRKLMSSELSKEGNVKSADEEQRMSRASNKQSDNHTRQDSNVQQTEKYNMSELVKLLERDISKDPQWAMLSVASLMILLFLAMKICGMRQIDRQHEVHVDLEEGMHLVDIYDILKLKKNFLPKRFQRLRRKWRRKYKKRFTQAKEKEVTPLSDNSEEEKLIYSTKMADF